MKVRKPKKVYWQGIEQLTNPTEFAENNRNEFPSPLPLKDAFGNNENKDLQSNRRDFLKLMGFSVAAVSLAACETPVKKAIPYLNKPEEIDPGIPNYYASTFVDGTDFCPVVVKTCEGRPILLQGNTFSSITKGKTSARVQASILSLYDNEKTKKPSKSKSIIDWNTLDSEVSTSLKDISNAGGQIRIVTNTIVSPSTKQVIQDFIQRYPTTQHISYDPQSAYGILKANEIEFGSAVIPSYDFSKADVVVSIGADFLGNWLSSMEYCTQFSGGRKVGKNKKTMSRHFQFESILSLTGANADYRTPIRPSLEGLVIIKLYNLIASRFGKETLAAPDVSVDNFERAAQALLVNQGKALVVAGSNDIQIQMVVNRLNYLLGAYDNIIDLSKPDYQRQGNDEQMHSFSQDLSNGKIDAVIFYNCNPVYNYPGSSLIESGIKKAKLSIATADRLDETASLCTYHAPDCHFLESWGDAEIKKGYLSLIQPAISRIFDTRQGQESLLKWAGKESNMYDYVKAYWKENFFARQAQYGTFEDFWVRSLHNGVLELSNTKNYTSIHDKTPTEGDEIDWSEVSSQISHAEDPKYEGLELIMYTHTIMGNGNQANNPMLQETPEPISKVCWGNFISVSPQIARERGFTSFEVETDVAVIKVNNQEYQLPVIVQPGQEKNTIAVSLGYGRNKKNAGKVAAEAGGINAFPLLLMKGRSLSNVISSGVSIEQAGRKENVAQTQTHHTIMDRETIIQEATLSEYLKDEQAGRYLPKISGYKGKRNPNDISIWDVGSDGYPTSSETGGESKSENKTWRDVLGLKADEYQYPQHHWGMAIDLNTCTGCAACVVACNLENNVPVVGKQEVVNRREMHWLRIDRYYSNPQGFNAKNTHYTALEKPDDNPEVVFQPMMCQHCNNAPCETVCPVAATTHSSEGLNQMTYNRCVGTKYCANNCPYKVRRFNWFKYNNNSDFDYHMNNDLGKMVLNPDVTVRSRGVMEKCSMCVQRIQAGKLKAKIEKRHLKDGDISTACTTACSSDAIVFGDLNDKNSRVRKLLESELDGRAYNVLEEINTNPNIWYLTKIRNKDKT